MAPELDQISLLVPLLLVIVERLATLTRDLVEEPKEFADTTPLFRPNISETWVEGDDWYLIPRLGRLNMIHMTNVVLLTAATILLAAAEPGLVSNLLALVVTIVWLQLPLIEVNCYDEIRDKITHPLSLYANIVGGFAIIAFVAGFGGFEPALFLREGNIFASNTQLIKSNPRQFGASLLLLGLVAGSSWSFLFLFEREVTDIDGVDKSATECDDCGGPDQEKT